MHKANHPETRHYCESVWDVDPRMEDPLHTITARDRFGLVMIAGLEYQISDIGLRMLSPRELYRAQGLKSLE